MTVGRASFDPAEWKTFHYLSRSFESTTNPSGDGELRANLRYVLTRNDDAAGSDRIELSETYRFPLPAHDQPEVMEVRRLVAERLLTHLWLVAGLSYYKLSAAPRIVVHGVHLSDEDLALHQLLLTRGLGEFCFVNNLDPELKPTWEFVSTPSASPSDSPNDSPNELLHGADLRSGPLVPVGGGKDSCVTIETLRRSGLTPTLVTVRRFPIIQQVIDASGLADVAVERTLDPQLVALNELGALNGHVPATAIVSFAALITAVLGGHDALVMSNERSASEGNVEYRGVSINHQWAKSDEAERAISAAVARITPELRWFSLLRPLSELEISRRFSATCARYFDTFSSCNRTQRIDPARRVSRWCGQCPKCQFVYLALATSLSRAEVERIWGTDLFLTSPKEGFRSLLGLADWKPFECVGEHGECRVALQLISEHTDWSGHPVLAGLVEEVRAAGGWPTQAEHADVFRSAAAPLIPPTYASILEAS
jgi:UDP-N-acetyl-alpha-D-muramoyl-L-alanyl-L-glutamate epimerase